MTSTTLPSQFLTRLVFFLYPGHVKIKLLEIKFPLLSADVNVLQFSREMINEYLYWKCDSDK